MTKITGKDNN